MKSIIQSHHGLKALTTGIASILLAWASVHPATAQIHNTTNGPNAVITNGIGAGASTTTGHDNSAYGFDALNLTTTGIANTALGSVALKSNTWSLQNIASMVPMLAAYQPSGSASIVRAHRHPWLHAPLSVER